MPEEPLWESEAAAVCIIYQSDTQEREVLEQWKYFKKMRIFPVHRSFDIYRPFPPKPCFKQKGLSSIFGPPQTFIKYKGLKRAREMA